MNLHQVKTATPLGSVDHCRVRHRVSQKRFVPHLPVQRWDKPFLDSYMRTHQGPWTARILRSRNEAEGGHFERLWIMPSTVWHLPVSNQDRPRCHLQFKETFIQV